MGWLSTCLTASTNTPTKIKTPMTSDSLKDSTAILDSNLDLLSTIFKLSNTNRTLLANQAITTTTTTTSQPRCINLGLLNHRQLHILSPISKLEELIQFLPCKH